MFVRLQSFQTTIDISKLKALDADPRPIQQTNFIGYLSSNNDRLIFFITEETKETILSFSQGTVKLL